MPWENSDGNAYDEMIVRMWQHWEATLFRHQGTTWEEAAAEMEPECWSEHGGCMTSSKMLGPMRRP